MKLLKKFFFAEIETHFWLILHPLLRKNEKRCVFAEEAWQRKPIMQPFKETHK